MCGRYTLCTPAETLIDRFEAEPDEPLEPRYNCAPGQRLPVITNEAPDRIQRFEWGLTPAWADEKHGLINARAETVADKRSFAAAYESRRCLVPCDGFYEWTDLGDGKRPYRVAFEDERPFALAGLFERWEPPTRQTGLAEFGASESDTDEGPIETFTVVTTEPNDLLSTLHHRMAVILAPEAESTWLHGDPETAAGVLEPSPDDDLSFYPVSERVNSPANDDPELIEPVAAE
jgi:putative SOS response-associated peptidase YedK